MGRESAAHISAAQPSGSLGPQSQPKTETSTCHLTQAPHFRQQGDMGAPCPEKDPHGRVLWLQPQRCLQPKKASLCIPPFLLFPLCFGPLDGREMSGGPGDKLEEQAPWREDLGVGVGVGILHWESGDPRSRAALPPSVVCPRQSLLFSRPRYVP